MSDLGSGSERLIFGKRNGRICVCSSGASFKDKAFSCDN